MAPEYTLRDIKSSLSLYLRWLAGEVRLVEERLCQVCHLYPPANPGHASCIDCEKELGHGG